MMEKSKLEAVQDLSDLWYAAEKDSWLLHDPSIERFNKARDAYLTEMGYKQEEKTDDKF